jgi:hypothetical protein
VTSGISSSASATNSRCRVSPGMRAGAEGESSAARALRRGIDNQCLGRRRRSGPASDWGEVVEPSGSPGDQAVGCAQWLPDRLTSAAFVCRQRRRSQPTAVEAIEAVIGARAFGIPPAEASRGERSDGEHALLPADIFRVLSSWVHRGDFAEIPGSRRRLAAHSPIAPPMRFRPERDGHPGAVEQSFLARSRSYSSALSKRSTGRRWKGHRDPRDQDPARWRHQESRGRRNSIGRGDGHEAFWSCGSYASLVGLNRLSFGERREVTAAF